MFKASIALVIFAFGALIYGWVQGIDSLLYGSIAFSALAGVFLLRSTLIERRKFASARTPAKNKEVRYDVELAEDRGLRDPVRASLAELSSHPRGEPAYQDPYRRTRAPIKPFGDSAPPVHQDDFGPEVEGDDLIQRTLNWVDASSDDEFDEYDEPDRPQVAARRRPQETLSARPQPAPEARPRPAPRARPQAARRAETRPPALPTNDFRARLASVLGDEPGYPPPPPQPVEYLDDREEEVQADWIRIEDVPRISRATQKEGGYARPELPAVQPPRRRTATAGTTAKAAAPRKPAPKGEPAPARRRTASPKAAAPKASTRTRAETGSTPRSAARRPAGETGDPPPRPPRGRPKAQP